MRSHPWFANNFKLSQLCEVFETPQPRYFCQLVAATIMASRIPASNSLGRQKHLNRTLPGNACCRMRVFLLTSCAIFPEKPLGRLPAGAVKDNVEYLKI